MLKYILIMLLGGIAIIISLVWVATDGFGYDYEKHGIIFTRIIKEKKAIIPRLKP